MYQACACKDECIAQYAPECQALGAVDDKELYLEDSLYCANQPKVIHTNTGEQHTCNISPHKPYALATLFVVVIAIAFVMLQQGFTLVGDATEVSIPTFGTVADSQGTQMVQ